MWVVVATVYTFFKSLHQEEEEMGTHSFPL